MRLVRVACSGGVLVGCVYVWVSHCAATDKHKPKNGGRKKDRKKVVVEYANQILMERAISERYCSKSPSYLRIAPPPVT